MFQCVDHETTFQDTLAGVLALACKGIRSTSNHAQIPGEISLSCHHALYWGISFVQHLYETGNVYKRTQTSI